jgi:hypothetical protein
MSDLFSTFSTGVAVQDRWGWEQYKASPGYQFDRLLNESPMISLAKICEETRVMTWVCHAPDVAWGFFRTDCTSLKPLADLDAICNTRHLMAISTREDWRGEGFWKVAMQVIIETAEKAGIMLHGISRPFVMRWPDVIRNAEEMLWFLDNDHKFFSYIHSAKEEKRRSKRLLEKYQQVGMCGFKYPPGNGFSSHARRKRYGFAYLSTSASTCVKTVIEPYLTC